MSGERNDNVVASLRRSHLESGLLGCELIDRIVVQPTVESTQDECRRRCEGRPGLLVTTLRQTAGRGRLGRRWIDERGEGLALTLAVRTHPPERLAIAAGLAVADAVESALPESTRLSRRLGIRWPNDVVAHDGRKIAGVLIETSGPIAFVGIGVNVAQPSFPPDLAPVATSMAILSGSAWTRQNSSAAGLDPSLAVAIVNQLADRFKQTDDALAAAFHERDVLRGMTRTFENGGQRFTGQITTIDPLKGLVVEIESGRVVLPAATTSLVPVEDNKVGYGLPARACETGWKSVSSIVDPAPPSR